VSRPNDRAFIHSGTTSRSRTGSRLLEEWLTMREDDALDVAQISFSVLSLSKGVALVSRSADELTTCGKGGLRNGPLGRGSPKMMYIGGVYGGPEVTGSTIDAAIGRVSALLGDSRVEESALLDIVFHLPGSLIAPDYQGVRTGRLSKRKGLLQIQVSVPQDIHSKRQSEAELFVVDALRQAIRIAGPRFAKAKIPYRQSEYERLIERVEKALSPN
jgi:hypothetical protein